MPKGDGKGGNPTPYHLRNINKKAREVRTSLSDKRERYFETSYDTRSEYDPQDYRDDSKYQAQCILVKNYIEQYGPVKYVSIARAYPETERHIDSILNTLSIDFQVRTFERHVTFVEAIPEQERQELLKDRARTRSVVFNNKSLNGLAK